MRRKKRNFKLILSAVLACALIVMPVTPASAATARATTMKLEKTEGTVTLKTQNGSARKITNGMHLYNGYTLATEKYSYAYVSLDSTKAVKLDQNSSAMLRQNGKDLELLVKSGKLFFNVSQPLTQKENMNVRTSTMVTGIRGTCGVVEYLNVNKSRLYLLEGKVTLGSGENATTIYGGQTATVVLQPKKESGGTDQPGESDKPSDMNNPEKEKEQKVLVEKMIEKTIPPVALQEIVSDPILQQKIEQTTELKMEKIEEAYEQFQKEEAERIEQEKEEQDKDKDAAEQTTENTNSFGGSSSTPSIPPAVPSTLSGVVSAAAINAALAANTTVTVEAGTDDATTEMMLEADVTIPVGKMLIVNYDRVNVSGSGQIDVGAGTLIDMGGALSDGWIKVGNTELLCVGDNPVYATELNAQVAGYLNQIVQMVEGTVTAKFEKDASVKSNISLSGSSNGMVLEMSTNTLTLESGTLTLNSNVAITGSDSATVQLNGGNLVMQGTSTSENAVISNNGGGYAIAHTSGTVKWTDKGMRVSASGVVNNSVSNAIQDATLKEDQLTAIMPSYVQIANGGLEWNTDTLSYLLSEFVNASEWVSYQRINAALQAYPTVTVGIAYSMDVAGTITIPAGKTLQITSKETQIGENQYSGSIDLSSDAKIILEDGASLVVSGTISGNGTIGNENIASNSKLKVEAGGTVRADTLQLMSCDIENAGIIDVGTIRTYSNGTIQNSNLIKTQKCELSSTMYTYTDTPHSVLICNETLQKLGGVSLLVTATASGSAVKQYFYAKELNPLMADRINNIKSTAGTTFGNNGASLWTFAKEAKINSAISIDFAGAAVEMGDKQMTIAAEGVKLNNIGDMTGTGTAVIYLTGDGSLTLGGTGQGTISNTNSTELYYAIAVKDLSNSIKTHLLWENENLTIESKKGTQMGTSNMYIIQGCSTDENNKYVLSEWAKCKENYAVEATQGSGIASLVKQ